MAWIALQQSVFGHRKTLVAAEELGVDEVCLVGHLASLWCWAIDSSPDGRLPSARIVAKAARWEADPAAFVAALRTSGFLDETEGGGLVIHDWDGHIGRLVSQREAAARRQREWRERSAAGNGNVTHNGTVTETRYSTVQNRTLQNRTGENGPRDARAASAPKGATPLSPDWSPSEDGFAWAAAKGWPPAWVASVTESFVNWNISKGRRYVVPERAWRNWLEREAREKPPARRTGPAPVYRPDQDFRE